MTVLLRQGQIGAWTVRHQVGFATVISASSTRLSGERSSGWRRYVDRGSRCGLLPRSCVAKGFSISHVAVRNALRLGSGRGGIRSIVIGLLICLAVKLGDRELAAKLIRRL